MFWVEGCIVRDGLKQFNKFCSIGFKRHYFNGLKSKSIFVCECYCAFTSCPTKIKVICPKPGEFVANFEGDIRHVGLKATKLSGERRKLMKAVLKSKFPRRAALDFLGNITDDIWLSGNRDSCPSQGVLKKVRQEATKIDLPNKSNIADSLALLRAEQRARDASKKVPGTLQRTYSDPVGLMFWSYETLKIFHSRAAIDAMFLDASGSIISGMNSKYYAYEIVARHPIKGKAPIAVGTYVTEKHSTEHINDFLKQFHADEKDIFRKHPISARKFVCDGSLVLLKSILMIYMEELLPMYLSRCHRVVTGKAHLGDLCRWSNMCV